MSTFSDLLISAILRLICGKIDSVMAENIVILSVSSFIWSSSLSSSMILVRLLVELFSFRFRLFVGTTSIELCPAVRVISVALRLADRVSIFLEAVCIVSSTSSIAIQEK